jgi:hypothetical protein
MHSLVPQTLHVKDKTDHPLSLSRWLLQIFFSVLSPSGQTDGDHHHEDPRHKDQLKNGFYLQIY